MQKFKRLIKADAVELNMYGYDKSKAKTMCRNIIESKGLDFDSLDIYFPPSHSDAYTGCFSENFNYALEYYAYKNENKNKFFVVIIMYDINNVNNYKTEYKEVEMLSDINFSNFEMNGEKFIKENNYLKYEEFLQNQEEQVAANKITNRLIKKNLRKNKLRNKISNKRKMYRKADEEGYTFDELDEDVKQNAISDIRLLMEEFYEEVFRTHCKEQINTTFPNSNIEYTYSFSYSQGDGVGLYGEIDLEDALNLTGISFSEDEKDVFEMYNIDSNGSRTSDIQINNDRGNTFFNDDMIEIYYNNTETEIEEIIEQYWRDDEISINISEFSKKIKQLETKLRKYVSDICDEMEKDGYDWLCPSDDMIIEDIKTNNFMFDEYGNYMAP